MQQTHVSSRYGTFEIAPPEDLLEYIPEFLGNRENDLVALQEALNKGNYVELFRLGHRIKGVCQPFGFEILGRIAKDLEAAAHREDRELCETLVKEFEAVLKDVSRDFPAREQKDTPALM
ncbi:MAG: Hpt domain-containing protein [Bdellovibrionaceae bacterium]|nr:Hpt domain-containing protein [Pseudobdellovibrionaceae bacterium]MBX3034821.1 Hpt domain-containing protein [Pseudobdellovibrionaceae bacterium]